MSFRKSEQLFKNGDASAQGRETGEAGFDLPAFVRLVRDRYPVKPAAHLAHVAQRSERCARQWLDGASKPDADSLSHLLAHFGTAMLPVLARGVDWADRFAKAEERERLERRLLELDRAAKHRDGVQP